jgi:hypothetical protein
MLLQPPFINGTFRALISSRLHIALKHNVYQRAMCLIFKVRIFSTIDFTQLEIQIILPIPIVYLIIQAKIGPKTDIDYRSITNRP